MPEKRVVLKNCGIIANIVQNNMLMITDLALTLPKEKLIEALKSGWQISNNIEIQLYKKPLEN